MVKKELIEGPEDHVGERQGGGQWICGKTMNNGKFPIIVGHQLSMYKIWSTKY